MITIDWAVRPIITDADHPALHSTCVPVEQWDGNVRDLVHEMIDAARRSPVRAISLAAPQIGECVRVIVYTRNDRWRALIPGNRKMS